MQTCALKQRRCVLCAFGESRAGWPHSRAPAAPCTGTASARFAIAGRVRRLAQRERADACTGAAREPFRRSPAQRLNVSAYQRQCNDNGNQSRSGDSGLVCQHNGQRGYAPMRVTLRRPRGVVHAASLGLLRNWCVVVLSFLFAPQRVLTSNAQQLARRHGVRRRGALVARQSLRLVWLTLAYSVICASMRAA